MKVVSFLKMQIVPFPFLLLFATCRAGYQTVSHTQVDPSASTPFDWEITGPVRIWLSFEHLKVSRSANDISVPKSIRVTCGAVVHESTSFSVQERGLT